MYSTFVGGTFGDGGSSLALDSAANAVITGRTDSADFPTTAGGYDISFGGGTCGGFPCDDVEVKNWPLTGGPYCTALLWGARALILAVRLR